MRATIRDLKTRTQTEVTLDDIARELNPKVGLDRLSWAIYSFSALSDGSLHQPHAGRLVEAKVQAFPPASGTRANVAMAASLPDVYKSALDLSDSVRCNG